MAEQPSTIAKVELEEVKHETKEQTKSHSEIDKDSPEFESVTEDVSFTSKVYLLVWKNYKSEVQRRKKAFACKILFPALIMILIGLLRNESKITTVNCNDQNDCGEYFPNTATPGLINPYTQTPITINEPISNITAAFNILKNWMTNVVCLPETDSSPGRNPNEPQPPMYLAIVPNPNTNTYLSKLMEILSENYIYDGSGINEGLTIEKYENETGQFININDCRDVITFTEIVNFTEGSLLKYFNNENELNEYISNKKYGGPGFNIQNNAELGLRPIGAAIIFDSISNDGLNWEYTLRFVFIFVVHFNNPYMYIYYL